MDKCMTAVFIIRDALSAFFQNQWLKWGSVFLLAGAYYYQTMSLGKVKAII